uniref:Helicase ATP-binding domain-containing protein n=1 Tax=Macrostomum lignano TaxID=282301 RepID=A0A1I8JRZ0_9PLAT
MTWRLSRARLHGSGSQSPLVAKRKPAIDAEPELDAHYDLIGCFNLLDRCGGPPGPAGAGKAPSPARAAAPPASRVVVASSSVRVRARATAARAGNDPMPVRDAEEAELCGQRASEFASNFIERRQLGLTTYYPPNAAQQDWLAGCFGLLERQVTYYGPDIAKCTRVPAKPWLPSLAPPFADVLAADAKLGHVRFNFALVNRYATGDNYIGGRAPGHATASRTSTLCAHSQLSLGAQRDFYFRQPLMARRCSWRWPAAACWRCNCQPTPNINVAMDAVKSAIARIPEAPEPLGEEFYAKHIKGVRRRLAWRQVFLGHGAILADEMGLGKTLQTVAFLLGLHGGRGRGGVSGRSLIVCPLSVLNNNWRDELAKFAPQLTVRVYTGDKAERERLRAELRREDWTLLLSTYELCLKDEEFFAKFSFDAMVVDEGHRLKNSNSQLHLALRALNVSCRFILTGTPIQNNLDELFTYSGALYEILKPFLLRRIKEDVLKSLPKKVERDSFIELSDLHSPCRRIRHCNGGNKTRLLNIQMQLRKCINHPYLFDGVEPEPFQPGEHLVTASAKLILIDRLLKIPEGQRAQSFTYERLDGSVRGEERFLAVKNFNQTAETFVFLLSTRAGGVGLNLVSADTVIFVDSDFNPQNDLQAAARVHRIGQTRCTVIGHGKFALGFDDADKAKEADASKQLMDDIEDADAVGSVDFGAVLGPTEQPGGRWVWSEPPEPPAAGKSVSASNAAASATSAAAAEEEAAARAHGKDYSSGAADIDQLEAKGRDGAAGSADRP